MNDDVKRCTFVWEISESPYHSEVIESPTFYAEGNDFITWIMRCRPRTILSFPVCLELEAMSLREINKHGPYVVISKFHIFSKKTSVTTIYEKKFTLSEDIPHNKKLPFRFIVDVCDISRDPFFSSSGVSVRCEISFHKVNCYVPKPIPCAMINAAPLTKISHSFKDYEKFRKLYLNEKHSDFTICIKFNGQLAKYPAHKTVLAARSKVFEAMFRHGMKENNSNQVVVEGIRKEVFLEALRYIYTGDVITHNLNSMVYELLPVADRYDLEKLRFACCDVLRKQLSVQTAVKTVILADMHNLADLKTEAIKFIKYYSMHFVRTMDSKAWGNLMARPHLMKDLLLENMKK